MRSALAFSVLLFVARALRTKSALARYRRCSCLVRGVWGAEIGLAVVTLALSLLVLGLSALLAQSVGLIVAKQCSSAQVNAEFQRLQSRVLAQVLWYGLSAAVVALADVAARLVRRWALRQRQVRPAKQNQSFVFDEVQLSGKKFLARPPPQISIELSASRFNFQTLEQTMSDYRVETQLPEKTGSPAKSQAKKRLSKPPPARVIKPVHNAVNLSQEVVEIDATAKPEPEIEPNIKYNPRFLRDDDRRLNAHMRRMQYVRNPQAKKSAQPRPVAEAELPVEDQDP